MEKLPGRAEVSVGREPPFPLALDLKMEQC